MPDYLEELLGGAEDLLEQVKRLERGLSGLTPERREAAPEETALASGETDDPEERRRWAVLSEAVWEEREAGGRRYDPASRQNPVRTQEEEPAPRRRSREEEIALPPERPEAEEERFRMEGFSPLLAQLERLERAALPLSLGGAGAGRGTGPALDLGVPPRAGTALAGKAGAAEEGWGGGGPDRYAAPVEEELRWAERADRAFRRDSRRYDGGFYLY